MLGCMASARCSQHLRGRSAGDDVSCPTGSRVSNLSASANANVALQTAGVSRVYDPAFSVADIALPTDGLTQAYSDTGNVLVQELDDGGEVSSRSDSNSADSWPGTECSSGSVRGQRQPLSGSSLLGQCHGVLTAEGRPVRVRRRHADSADPSLESIEPRIGLCGA